MNTTKNRSSYDKSPVTLITSGGPAWQGYADICGELKRAISKAADQSMVISIECYPGVRQEEILLSLIKLLAPALVIHADDAAMATSDITAKMQPFLTDDRVFGFRYPFVFEDFFIPAKLAEMRKRIEEEKTGLVVVYGVGATLVHPGDILIYANLARWEIQQRYRSGEIGNWKADNADEDILRKYKRGFFIEWRMADKLKKSLYEKITYLLDTNLKDTPKMITGGGFLSGLRQIARRPFRLVPYFDPGVWGGQWMKDVCGLDSSVPNYAWSFDGVPEENSLYLQYDEVRVEVPAIDLVLYQPVPLLGEKVYGRFGTEYPIRFDFLDTMGGQNLSLQVHPLTEYIQDTFGMHYTQEESYYLLDAKEGATVYLGLKEGIDSQAMIRDLKRAQAGEISFPAEQYINIFPAKKHDHFLIPPGTVHCSGSDCMVLEISATPYIFTFKLWDWDRLGLDGRPRPVHIEHGEKVIQWDFNTQWVEENLLPCVESTGQGNGWREEKTGLHQREFIETRRTWITESAEFNTEGNFHMLNLVAGSQAVIESPTGAFPPFAVHYAETFIIPASVGTYTIRPNGCDEKEEIAVIRAYVRN